ncbi:MAG: hypothetical protein QW327_00945 [Candidatus Odinarchaeota archaeon]
MSQDKSKPIFDELEEEIMKTLDEELAKFSEQLKQLKDPLINQFDTVRLKFVIPLISSSYDKIINENFEDLKNEFKSEIKEALTYLMQNVRDKFSNKMQDISVTFDRIIETEKDNVKRLEYEKKSLEDKVASLTAEVEKRDKIIKDYVAQIGELKKNVFDKDAVAKDYLELKRKFDDLNREYLAIQEDKASLEAKIATLTKQNEIYKNELNELNIKQKNVDDKLKSLQNQLAEAHSENMFLTNKLNELKSARSEKPAGEDIIDAAKVKAEIKILKDALSQKNSQAADLENQISKLTDENNSLKNKIEESKMRVEQLESELQRVKKDLGRASEYDKRLNQLQMEYAELQRINAKQREELNRVEKLKKILVSEPKFKVLQILESVNEISIEALNTAIGYTPLMTKKIINELSEANIVEVNGNSVKLKREKES